MAPWLLGAAGVVAAGVAVYMGMNYMPKGPKGPPRCELTPGGEAPLSCRDDYFPGLQPTQWWGPWVNNPDLLASIKQGLAAGQLVKITDALSPAVAQALFDELEYVRNWEQKNQFSASAHPQGITEPPGGIQFSRKILKEPVPETLVAHFHTFLKSSLEFWEKVAPTKLGDWAAPAASEFDLGDFLSPHTDFSMGRAVTLQLYLSKDWREDIGGTFWWLKDTWNSTTNGMHTPDFNTMLMFMPSPQSIHMVSPVSTKARTVLEPTARRFAICGWFVAAEEEKVNHTQRIEKEFPRSSNAGLIEFDGFEE